MERRMDRAAFERAAISNGGRPMTVAIRSPFGYLMAGPSPTNSPTPAPRPAMDSARVLAYGLLGILLLSAAMLAWMWGSAGRAQLMRAGYRPDVALTIGWAFGWLGTLAWLIGGTLVACAGMVNIVRGAMELPDGTAIRPPFVEPAPTANLPDEHSPSATASAHSAMPETVSGSAIDQATVGADDAHAALSDAARGDWAAFEASASRAYVGLYGSLITVAEFDPHLLAKGCGDPMVSAAVSQSLALIGELNGVRMGGPVRHPSESPMVRASRERLKRLTNGPSVVDEDLSAEY